MACKPKLRLTERFLRGLLFLNLSAIFWLSLQVVNESSNSMRFDQHPAIHGNSFAGSIIGIVGDQKEGHIRPLHRQTAAIRQGVGIGARRRIILENARQIQLLRQAVGQHHQHHAHQSIEETGRSGEIKARLLNAHAIDKCLDSCVLKLDEI